VNDSEQEFENEWGERLTRLRNRKIGFIFQRYELLPNLTALENVILPMMYAGLGRPVRQKRAIAALTHMGLANRMDKRPPQLSGGQQQRVAIARAIGHLRCGPLMNGVTGQI